MVRRTPRTSLATAIVLLTWVAPSFAAPRLSLPLQGYYRPGAYMPVELLTDAAGGDARVTAAGATTVSWTGGAPRIVLPLLVTGGRLADLRVDGGPVYAGELRALGDDERLVVSLVAGPGPALFDRAQRVVTVPLEPAAALSPPEAWTGVDAILLDAASYATLDDGAVDVLRAGGVVLALRGEAPPDARPWVTAAGWQVLRPLVVGPRRVVVSDAAYAPTQAWQPGWSPTMRWTVVLIGGVAGVVAMAAATVPRRAVGVVVASGIVCVAGVAGWIGMTPPVFGTRGSVTLVGAETTQRDTWAFQTAARPARQAYRTRGLTWPVFADPAHRAAAEMELRCGADGRPVAFTYGLPARGAVGFLSRNLNAEIRRPELGELRRTAMDGLVRRLYPGTRTVGSLVGGGAADELGDVVVEPRDAPQR